MGALVSQLAVRRDSGSGTVTILNVRVVPQPCMPVCCSAASLTAMHHVSGLKMVTQCAMLEKFGIFLVLADKVKDSFCFIMRHE